MTTPKVPNRVLKRWTKEVAMGAKLFDEAAPAWPRAFDIDKLDLGSYTECPLGQVLGNGALAERQFFGKLNTDEADAHGFWCPEDDEEYQFIVSRWIYEVEYRLARTD